MRRFRQITAVFAGLLLGNLWALGCLAESSAAPTMNSGDVTSCRLPTELAQVPLIVEMAEASIPSVARYLNAEIGRALGTNRVWVTSDIPDRPYDPHFTQSFDTISLQEFVERLQAQTSVDIAVDSDGTIVISSDRIRERENLSERMSRWPQEVIETWRWFSSQLSGCTSFTARAVMAEFTAPDGKSTDELTITDTAHLERIRHVFSVNEFYYDARMSELLSEGSTFSGEVITLETGIGSIASLLGGRHLIVTNRTSFMSGNSRFSEDLVGVLNLNKAVNPQTQDTPLRLKNSHRD